MKPITLLILLATVLPSLGSPVKIELPHETVAFKFAPGSEIANGQCLTCHSVEYVSTQPPLPRAFWASSVKKMQDKYGASVPTEQVEALVEYLVRNYGVTTNAAPTNVTNAPASSTTVLDGQSIAMKYGCLSCHNVSMKIVGPSYKDIADKYRKDAAAKTKVAEQIRNGGSGKWGPIIMPPFPQVTPEEVRLVSDWILGQK